MAKATRDAYGEEIALLVAENDKIVVLDADLAGSTRSGKAQKVAPERFFDLGIAEADMIGHAAGLAASGYTAFASSFAMFATGRTWEQIRNSVAYPHLNVKIVGSHAGITVGEDGVSHQATEDIAIMRAIPGMQVFCPADATETKAVIDYVAQSKSPCYVRCGRAPVEEVYPESEKDSLDITKVHVLREGDGNLAVFATGVEVDSAVKAADRLKEEGINITVVDVCAIKPCDEEGIVKILESHKQIVTAEEHNIIGGLGGMICEVASQYCPRKITRIGVVDEFCQSGEANELMHEYKLDADGIYQQIKELL